MFSSAFLISSTMLGTMCQSNNDKNYSFFIYKLLTLLVNQGSKPTCPRE